MSVSLHKSREEAHPFSNGIQQGFKWNLLQPVLVFLG